MALWIDRYILVNIINSKWFEYSFKDYYLLISSKFEKTYYQDV